jgi:hypothetical protein
MRAMGWRAGLRVVIAAASAALCVSLWTAPGAHAYQDLFRPVGGDKKADPCHSTGDAGGTIVKPNVKPSPGSNVAVDLTLLCGPLVEWPNAGPFPSTLLWDDAVWQRYMHRSGGPPGHAMSGGEEKVLWNENVSTARSPWLKGPNGGAPEEIEVLNNKALKAVIQHIIIVTGVAFVTAVTACVTMAVVAVPLAAAMTAGGPFGAVAAAGLLATMYFKCTVAIAAVGGIAVFTALFDSVVSGAVTNIWNKFLGGRIDVMSNTNWFAWSNGLGGWNTFGDVGPRFINPSLYTLFGHRVRVGVVFATSATSQGPSFADAKENSAEPQPPPPALQRTTTAKRREAAKALRRLDLVALAEGRRTDKQHVFAFNGFKTGGRHVKRGRPGVDYMFAGKGTVTLDGDLGNDTLRAGSGADVLIGGRGADKLFGNRAADRMDGGPGNDLIVDGQGSATIEAGSGDNVVDVRGHRGHDTIDCAGSTHNRILANKGDTIATNCG